MGAAAICIVTMHYLCRRCVPNRGHNIPTRFGNNRSNSKEIKNFFESHDGGEHLVEFGLFYLVDSIIYVVCIKVAINLVLICRIGKK